MLRAASPRSMPDRPFCGFVLAGENLNDFYRILGEIEIVILWI